MTTEHTHTKAMVKKRKTKTRRRTTITTGKKLSIDAKISLSSFLKFQAQVCSTDTHTHTPRVEKVDDTSLPCMGFVI